MHHWQLMLAPDEALQKVARADSKNALCYLVQEGCDGDGHYVLQLASNGVSPKRFTLQTV